MKRITLGWLMLLCWPACWALAQPSATPTLTEKALDSIITQKMAQGRMVGVGASLIVNKQVVWMKGYGYADRETQKPFTPGVIMNIGSITKTVTGVCLMRLAEEKKLSLDEDINRYLPFRIVNPYFPDEKITLRQLATHTSSLNDRYPFYTDSTYFYGSDSPEQLGDFLKNYFVPGGKYYAKDNFLNARPGTQREYSNIAAGLAGYIAERVAHQKLNIYSKHIIFKPLKMSHTGWFLSEVDLSNHAKLYDKVADTIKNIPLYGCTTYPDGGVRTSVAELSRFFAMLLNGGSYQGATVLKKATADEMLRFEYTAASKPTNVADPARLNSGIFWATKLDGTRIGHGGSDPGVKTEMLADLNKDIGIVLFTNTTMGGKDIGRYLEIYNALYAYGQQLKAAGAQASK